MTLEHEQQTNAEGDAALDFEQRIAGHAEQHLYLEKQHTLALALVRQIEDQIHRVEGRIEEANYWKSVMDTQLSHRKGV